MTLLGRLLRNRRGLDAAAAWNRPNLNGPDVIALTSPHFDDGQAMPAEHAAKGIGGRGLSPALAWSPTPSATTALVLVVEDLDVPLATPAVHCLAVIDPTRLETAHQLPVGGLSARDPASGVRILRSTVGRGYHGPAPIKGHGPHRYAFQLFALTADIADDSPTGGGPRKILSGISGPVLARGRLTGTYER